MTHSVTSFPQFVLEDGTVLSDPPVAYKTWGKLNNSADNAVIICHALTGDCNADSWWSHLVGPGKSIDTNKFFVVCANTIASPYGTVSPITTNPETGSKYGKNFPISSIRDTVNLHKKLLDKLGVKGVAFCIGGSMGGMQALEWSFFEDFVKGLIIIGTSGRHSAWCIAWSETQRQAIYKDPNWKDGSYSSDSGPDAGLAIARMIAMISYRSFESFGKRFGREKAKQGSDQLFSVETYLHHHGDKLVDRFDANCYVRLTQSMDKHDISRERGNYFDVLSQIKQPALIVGIDTDILYPLSEQKELADHMPNATLERLSYHHGHDSFLIELENVNDKISKWIEKKINSL